VNHTFALVIESLVSLLLLLTILYCVALNRQLKRLKADETTLRSMISELVTATAVAERAIAGLRGAVGECEQGLGERLQNAERLTAELERQFAAGENLFSRLSRIASAAQPSQPPQARQVPQVPQMPQKTPPTADTKAILAAAQAFTDRARSRLRGIAA
jgi:Domain of unknown function (DUF6468)